MKPSKNLEKWLISQFSALSPGSRLPTPQDMAKQWNVSVSTVRLILRKFQENGDLVCIRGRGTFIPFNKPLGMVRPPRTSSGNVVRFVLRAIHSGSLRRGQALPAVKYMCFRFKVAPATVIKAYARLAAEEVVTKIGKTFWVGGRDTFLNPSGEKEVVFFNYRSRDFRNVFWDDWMAPAFQKMERELRAHGFTIRYESTQDLSDVLSRFVIEGNWPHGIFFHKLREDRFDEINRILRRYQNEIKLEEVPVLIDWRRGDWRKIPKGIQVFSRGNVFTMRARTAARHIMQKGYDEAYLFYDENRRDYSWLLSFIRLRSELEALECNVRFKVCVRPNAEEASPQAFFKRLKSSRPDGWLTQVIMSKYRAVEEKEIEGMFEFPDQFQDCYDPKGKKRILLFTEDKRAARALDWARSCSLSVPEDVAIMTFENNPRFLHHGLSCCVPDWEQIGYLMAHSIIGDFRVEKTGKGFLRVKTDVVERGTT